jgi:choline dehydrogenase-like flavoprotein
MDGRYDIIVIGSGAGGSTLAWRLAAAGIRVLIIERGGFSPAVCLDRKWNL